MSDNELSKLSRETLYEKVWSMSGVKLSEALGVSDVAIAKRCRKLNVPRPPRGYWAKVEAGQRPKRPSLPPTPEQAFIHEAQKPVSRRLEMPAESEPLHPLAAEFLRALKSASLSYDKKRVHLRERSLPEADVSKDIALRAAQAFHTLLQITEPRGIKFGRSQSKYDGGHFRKGHDYLFFKIEEELVDKPETAVRKKSYYSRPEDNKVPCGKLGFTLKPERYGSSKTQEWKESDKAPLETMLAEMAKFICEHYVETQKRREAEAIEREKQRVESEISWKKHQEEEAIRKEEAAKRKHAESLESVEQHRKDDLAKAAEWWRLHQSTVDFIAECERRWRDAQEGRLMDDQECWLSWARETAKSSSPFEIGYPQPSIDGAFDPAEVPFGGPYPALRKFPQPPTMPDIPAPVIVQQSYGAPSYQPSPEPYPFWLRNRSK